MLLEIVHVWHLWLEVVGAVIITKSLALASWVATTTILVLSLASELLAVLDALCFFLSIKDHELLTELLVWHSEFLSDLNKASEAINIVMVFTVDVFIHLQRIIK